MLHRLKRLVPEPLVSAYHYALARLAAFCYGHPSERMVVIGVTGTNGKTTTAYLMAHALEASGFPTGCTTTAIMKVGEKEWLNKTKMTMPGRFYLQRMLKEMADAGCRYAVIETSSQGLIQFRHIGINYDLVVYTNLTPEHIEAHGGFENYKRAKQMLFEHLARSPVKSFVSKTAILNADDPHAQDFASVPGIHRVAWYGMESSKGLRVQNVQTDAKGSRFSIDDVAVSIRLPGRYNVMNALAALAVCRTLGVDLKKAAEKLSAVTLVPGRFQRVDAGQPWTVVIDYAPEPESMRRLYETVMSLPHGRIIHVLGSCGGGRDAARRPILGRLAGEHADTVIVTNEDPYDDDPQTIIDQVAAGAREAGKTDGHTLHRFLDRREAIQKAMQIAQDGDFVLLTGKGCEPWMCVEDGKKLPWDEEAAAREAIRDVLRSR